MNIHVNVGVSAGSDIENTVEEMHALADRLNTVVRAQFNNVTLIVRPGDVVTSMADAYLRELRGPHQVKIVTSEAA